MGFIIDFLLLAASGTACLYCWILSKRLKGLTGAEAGLGAGIAALSQSAEDMKSAVSSTKASADESASSLESLLLQADERAAQLQGLIDQLDEMSGSVVAHSESATQKYMETLAPFLDEANLTAERLLTAIEASAGMDASPRPEDKSQQKSAKSKPSSGTDEDDVEFETVEEAPVKKTPQRKRARAGA